jgi:hypothetical protein
MTEESGKNEHSPYETKNASHVTKGSKKERQKISGHGIECI